MQVALGFLVLGAKHAVGRGKLGHDQPATAKIADEAAKDRVCDASHGRQHGSRRDFDTADVQLGWNGGGPQCLPSINTGEDARPTIFRVVPLLAHRSILSVPQNKAPAVAGAKILIRRFPAYFFSPALAYFRRKRSTRPAVSINFCLPVKNGWQLEQISTWMSPLCVERVLKVLPHAQCKRISLKLGWIAAFIDRKST